MSENTSVEVVTFEEKYADLPEVLKVSCSKERLKLFWNQAIKSAVSTAKKSQSVSQIVSDLEDLKTDYE